MDDYNKSHITYIITL